MFDFPLTEFGLWTALYCILFYAFILFKNFNKGLLYYNDNLYTKKNTRFALIVFGFFLATHCVKGDFFSLMEVVHNYDFTIGTYNYGEPIYQTIAKIVNRNYFLFRIIVWSGSFVLYCFTAKNLKIPIYYAAVMLVLTHATTFGYARATAAMALYFYGLSLVTSKKRGFFNTILKIVIGVLLILGCRLFHRSAIIMIAMTFMLFVPVKKWSVLIVLIGIPLIVVLLRGVFDYMLISEEVDEVIANKLLNYSEREINRGIANKLINYTLYASFLVPMGLLTLRLFSNGVYKRLPINVLAMYKVTFGLTIAAIAFLLLGSTFVTFFYRILFMTMIPLSLLLVYCYQNNILLFKNYNICVYIGVLYNIMKYLYDLYLVFIGTV